MIQLRNKDTATPIGEITEEQLDFLVDMLEEEDSEDQDYWIDEMTLQYFQENGADLALIKLLQDAIGESEGIEIEWVPDEEEKEDGSAHRAEQDREPKSDGVAPRAQVIRPEEGPVHEGHGRGEREVCHEDARVGEDKWVE